MAYVLLNARRHFYKRYGTPPPQVRLDPASSAPWFEGWKHPQPPPTTPLRDIADARTWLLSKGWRRYRLIDPAEVPGR